MEHALPRVLVVNDDGITAPGIGAVVRSLHDTGRFDLRVAAPSAERSACSHSMTLWGPLSARYELDGRKLGLSVPVPSLAVDGTPADAVSLALVNNAFAVEDGNSQGGRGAGWLPEVVVSGINRGANFSTLVCYSGTVAGAREAALQGVKGLAASLDSFRARTEEDFLKAALILNPIVEWYANEQSWPRNVVLNVNIPWEGERGGVDRIGVKRRGGPPIGLIVSRMGRSYITSTYTQLDKTDGNNQGNAVNAGQTNVGSGNGGMENDGEELNGRDNRVSFKLGGVFHYDEEADVENDDALALSQGLVAMSPIGLGDGRNCVDKAFECLRRWQSEYQHPTLEWVTAKSLQKMANS